MYIFDTSCEYVCFFFCCMGDSVNKYSTLLYISDGIILSLPVLMVISIYTTESTSTTAVMVIFAYATESISSTAVTVISTYATESISATAVMMISTNTTVATYTTGSTSTTDATVPTKQFY
jgi:hypothetical protein